jgi:uncharacterized repeat protein (TIGR03803 family)
VGSANSDGANPADGLVLSGNTLYGAATDGGSNGNGTLFSFITDSSVFTLLYTFEAEANGTNLAGELPRGGLVLGGGTLYGTAANGGTNGKGTLFAISTNGGPISALHTFFGAADGANPQASLALSGNVLYGTTSAGGANDRGTVFAVPTNGAFLATLYTFSRLVAATNQDGASPNAAMILSASTLYGTTEFGGTGNGVIFGLTILPVISNLAFSGTDAVLNVINGLAGRAYIVLSSADLTLPLNEWSPLATNVLTVGGSFTITATNALILASPQQFYSLQVQ